MNCSLIQRIHNKYKKILQKLHFIERQWIYDTLTFTSVHVPSNIHFFWQTRETFAIKRKNFAN